MDILSAIITIFIWVFIGKAIKNRQQSRRSASHPVGTPAAPAQPVARKAAAAAQKAAAPVQRTPVKEVKTGKEKAKGAYSPVVVPPETHPAQEHKHTVQPSFEPGAHAHEETSMTGFKECPPETKPAAKKPAPAAKPVPAPQPAPVPAAAPAPAPLFSFAFTKEDAVRAIVYSEILAKPKALR